MWYFANYFCAKCAVNDNKTVQIVANFEIWSETNYNTLGSFCRFQLNSLLFLSCFSFLVSVSISQWFFFSHLMFWQSDRKYSTADRGYRYLSNCQGRQHTKHTYLRRIFNTNLKIIVKTSLRSKSSECECESDAIDIFKSIERETVVQQQLRCVRFSLLFSVFFSSLLGSYYISLVYNAFKCCDSNIVFK